jgi:hypothetical protein
MSRADRTLNRLRLTPGSPKTLATKRAPVTLVRTGIPTIFAARSDSLGGSLRWTTRPGSRFK